MPGKREIIETTLIMTVLFPTFGGTKIMLSFLFFSFLVSNTEVVRGFSSNYLDSLAESNVAPARNFNYLDSLCRDSTQTDNFQPKETQMSPPSNNVDLEKVAAETPSSHYAKRNPGAGWAGYQHKKFGGYLNNLRENHLEEGKTAQVYLDRI